jgi:hypothetical protein
MIVNRAQLADIMGVSAAAVGQWTDDGMPVLGRGGSGVESSYDSAQCINWRVERAAAAAPGAADRARLVRVQADRAELELRVRLGELLPLGELRRAVAAIVRASAEGFLNLAPQLAGTLAGLDCASIQTALDAEIRTRLNALADALEQLVATYEKPGAASDEKAGLA